MLQPKVSIITTNYNDADHLREIIGNIAGQDYGNMEYIIVDGGSGDHFPKVIEEAEELFGDRLKWISEPDKGIFDAINKGLKLAAGDIIGCCFDEFTCRDAITKMVSIMEKEGTDGVHADINYMNGNTVVRKWRQGTGKVRWGWMPAHQSLFLRREVYEKYGIYKTDYRIAADYEFMIRFLKDNRVRLSYIPQVLVHMSHGGTSTNSLKAYMESFGESYRALKENNVPFPLLGVACKTVRVLLQFVRS